MISNRRKRSRSVNDWIQVKKTISDLTDYEKDVIDYALKNRPDFPRPDYEVKRVIQEAKGSCDYQSTIVESTKNNNINLDAFLQKQTHEKSLNYLQTLCPPESYNPCPTVEELSKNFQKNDYFLNQDDIFSIHQALLTGRPIKVDGPPGTGKTELARQIAIAVGLDVNNPFHFGELFCTPDISKGEAFYSWNDAKRLIDMQLVSNLCNRMSGEELKKSYVEVSNNAYSPRYLDLQCLLKACVVPYRTIVLVDEVDKTYHEFDNYLLSVVDQNRFVVPEYGPVGRSEFNPKNSPIFILTSNMTRSLSGPLVRRCKSLFYDYLPENLEEKVVYAKAKVGKMEAGLIAHFFKKVRTNHKLHLQQPPSTAEVIETAKAMKETNMEINEKNIFKMHCHWIKYRVDYNALCESFKRNGDWSDNIEE